MKTKHALTIYTILWTLLITWACSGCASTQSGFILGPCYQNAKRLGAEYSEKGYQIRYGHLEPARPGDEGYMWMEYLNDNNEWVKIPDGFKDIKAHWYGYPE